ncbi:iron ABC transporter permease [Terribacillus sp. 179-K 1B1 HS]|uniref:ABC transporter permease n=1 Tax=Terribacillus sp. 179-K 1B1 HS TaxID=3142388 RepID=UPI0039A3107C
MYASKQLPFWMLFALLGLLAAAPLLAVLGYTFMEDGSLSFTAFSEALKNDRILTTMEHSFTLGLLVILGTTIIALPLAIIRTKTQFAHKHWLDIVFTIPFMTPPYIGSMGWMQFMQHNGYYESLFSTAAPASFFSLAGMVFIMSMHLYPFLYLMLRNTLVRINGSFQEAADIYGRSPVMNWIRIVLPLLLSTYAMASLLIFIKTLAEFGTPATFGKQIGFYVFTTEIHQYLSRWPVNISAATSLSLILLSVCMVIWYLQNIISRKYTHGIHSGRSIISANKQDSLSVRLFSWLFVSIVLLLSIGVPYFSIIATSLLQVRGNGLHWDNLTFSHYTELFSLHSEGFSALMNSLGFAFAAATIAAVIGLFTALSIKNAATKSQQLMDFTSMMPNIIPGIVFVVGLILFWNMSWLPATVYNTTWMPIVTYIVLFLPYAVQYTKGSLSQLHQSIHHSNAVYGTSNFTIFVRIWLPLLAQGILAGWIMTFIISMRELVGSLLILPPSVSTSATFIYSQFEQGDAGVGMAMAVITVLLTILFITLMNWLQRKALTYS